MFGVTRSMFGVTRSIFGVTRSIFRVTRSIFGVTRSIFRVKKSIFGVKKSIFGVKKSIFSMTKSNCEWANSNLIKDLTYFAREKTKKVERRRSQPFHLIRRCWLRYPHGPNIFLPRMYAPTFSKPARQCLVDAGLAI